MLEQYNQNAHRSYRHFTGKDSKGARTVPKMFKALILINVHGKHQGRDPQCKKNAFMKWYAQVKRQSGVFEAIKRMLIFAPISKSCFLYRIKYITIKDSANPDDQNAQGIGNQQPHLDYSSGNLDTKNLYHQKMNNNSESEVINSKNYGQNPPKQSIENQNTYAICIKCLQEIQSMPISSSQKSLQSALTHELNANCSFSSRTLDTDELQKKISKLNNRITVYIINKLLRNNQIEFIEKLKFYGDYV